MKSGPLAGFSGGLAGVIAASIFYPVGTMIGLLPPSQADPITFSIKILITTIIFGIIFVFIYSKFFDCVPS